jgi:hypothetical protein
VQAYGGRVKDEDLPPFPEELEYVHRWWGQAAGTRQVGMAANPITFLELEAMQRQLLLRIPVWETKLIMRLDRAVLRALTSKGKGAKPAAKGQGAEPLTIPASNTAGIAALMRSKMAALAHKGPKVDPDG